MPTILSARLVRFGLLCLFAATVFSSCVSSRYYRQRVMFQLTDEKGHNIDTAKLKTAVNRVAKNYLIQPNDYLEVHVYTNKGERILDPNGELHFGSAAGAARSIPGGGTGASPNASSGAGAGAGNTSSGSDFLVQADGTVMLPMVNRVKVTGLSLLQADSVLKSSYSEFYKEAFVTTRVTNNRVFMLGASGGKVVTLQNDNMNLLEVLALAGGIDGTGGAGGSSLYRFGGKANNIRVIRGDLKNPQIQQIDLTTLDGMRKGNLQVEPNDIIYVEPVRRPFLETLTDASPAITATAIVLNATVIVISVLRR